MRLPNLIEPGTVPAELTNQTEPSILDTLAAALAANGQYERAAATAQKALDLLADKSTAQLIERLTKRLDLYRRGMPYVEPKPAAETK